MTVVLDANILLRFVDATAAQHAITVRAIEKLKADGANLRAVPQSFQEFWVVATRPVANNGLGLDPVDCDREIDSLEVTFPPLDDPPGLFAEWRSLVTTYRCRGKVAHDARYVAALRRHGLAHLLTFNGADFARYAGVTVLDPAAVAAGP